MGWDGYTSHRVCLSDFYMDKYLVTQSAYQGQTGNNPSLFTGCPNCPVEKVSWDDAESFCGSLGKRLPTEAEWEYAARNGGKHEKWAGTNKESELGNYAWYHGNSGSKTHPVGEKQPNGLGLYDMSGNVWEWVSDWYDENYYRKSPRDNPQGPDSGQYRVLRGGSWLVSADTLRAALRSGSFAPDYRLGSVGIRCAK